MLQITVDLLQLLPKSLLFDDNLLQQFVLQKVAKVHKKCITSIQKENSCGLQEFFIRNT